MKVGQEEIFDETDFIIAEEETAEKAEEEEGREQRDSALRTKRNELQTVNEVPQTSNASQEERS